MLCQLHLRVCSAPYTRRLTCYPYSTASGSSATLPILVFAHEVVVGCDPFELVSAISRRCVDLDERRNAADLAHIAGYTALLATLPPLIDSYTHMHADHYHTLLAEHGRGLTAPHAAYLQSQRRRRVLRWMADERLQSTEQCRERVERVLRCFSRALQASPCEYLFSRQPSSADVMLAAYIAFLALAPHEDATVVPASATRPPPSAQPVSASSSPFIPLSSLLTSHPLLLLHSRLLFDHFFSAFSFHPPQLADVSPATVSEYVKRGERAAAEEATWEHAIDAAGLLSEMRGRLSEPPLPRGRYTAPFALPTRGGDQWVEQSKATPSAEERERMVQRSRRMWLLGGAALVLAFVLWQRSKVSLAAAGAAGGVDTSR